MSEFSFNRSVRILRPADFQRVFADPLKSGNSEFTVLATANGLPHARLGLAIAKKRVRLAVDRNRIKRHVRESFRHHQAELPALDIVVMARNGVEKRTNEKLVVSLDKHWQSLIKKCASSS